MCQRPPLRDSCCLVGVTESFAGGANLGTGRDKIKARVRAFIKCRLSTTALPQAVTRKTSSYMTRVDRRTSCKSAAGFSGIDFRVRAVLPGRFVSLAGVFGAMLGELPEAASFCSAWVAGLSCD